MKIDEDALDRRKPSAELVRPFCWAPVEISTMPSERSWARFFVGRLLEPKRSDSCWRILCLDAWLWLFALPVAAQAVDRIG